MGLPVCCLLTWGKCLFFNRHRSIHRTIVALLTKRTLKLQYAEGKREMRVRFALLISRREEENYSELFIETRREFACVWNLKGRNKWLQKSIKYFSMAVCNDIGSSFILGYDTTIRLMGVCMIKRQFQTVRKKLYVSVSIAALLLLIWQYIFFFLSCLIIILINDDVSFHYLLYFINLQYFLCVCAHLHAHVFCARIHALWAWVLCVCAWVLCVDTWAWVLCAYTSACVCSCIICMCYIH